MLRLGLVSGLVLGLALGASPAVAQSTASYTYDAQGQLTGVSRPSGQIGYQYDQAGNRIQITTGTQGAAQAVSGSAIMVQLALDPAETSTAPPPRAYDPTPIPFPSAGASFGPPRLGPRGEVLPNPIASSH